MYTEKGITNFSNSTSKFDKGKFSSSSAQFSLTQNSSLQKKQRDNNTEVQINQYDCRSPSSAQRIWGIEFGRKEKNYSEVFAYGVSEQINENNFTTLHMISREVFRIFEFESPVKQVMSCRHHAEKASQDQIFIMLETGNMFKVNPGLIPIQLFNAFR